MKIIVIKTKGLEIDKEVPETVAEYDTLAEEKGACLEVAITASNYNYWNKDFGEALCKELEVVTEVPRKVKTSEAGNESFDESETAYIDRLKSEGALTEAKYKQIGKKIGKRIAFSCKARTRKAAPAKETVTLANDLLEAISAKKTTEENVKASFVDQIDDLKNFDEAFGDLNEESLIAAITRFDEQEARKAKEKKDKFLG